MDCARRLQLALGLQLGLGYALARAAGLPGGWWAALAAGCALPCLLTAAALGCELLVQGWHQRRGGGTTLVRSLRTWLGETVVSLRSFCWRQPFLANFPEPPLGRDPTRPAVLLVHGYGCNRAVWLPLIRSGRLDGFHVATVDLAADLRAIEAQVPLLAAAAGRLRAASGARRLVLVAHSMGGLAARALLQTAGGMEVDQLITLGTPHAGTWFARFGPGRAARQMRLRNPWLAALERATDAGQRGRCTCIASADDNLILPRASAHLAGARNLTVRGIGHLELTVSPVVWDLLVARIAAAGGDGPALSGPAAGRPAPPPPAGLPADSAAAAR